MKTEDFRQSFFDWYASEFGREADLTDGQTHLMFQAYRAGFVVGQHDRDYVPDMTAVMRSPITVKQTPESAREIGRRLGRQIRQEMRRTTLADINEQEQPQPMIPEMGEFDDRY